MTHDPSIDWKAARPGEQALAFDPAVVAGDAQIIFIGRVRSPWLTRSDCPRNLRQARERCLESGQQAELEIAPAFREGLRNIDAASHLILLYWMHEARRDLIVQSPRHASAPRGVFALRSPVRPNPIGLGIVKLVAVDIAAGRVVIDAIDCVDGTPLIDIKPYFAASDAFPDATTAER